MKTTRRGVNVGVDVNMCHDLDIRLTVICTRYHIRVASARAGSVLRSCRLPGVLGNVMHAMTGPDVDTSDRGALKSDSRCDQQLQSQCDVRSGQWAASSVNASNEGSLC